MLALPCTCDTENRARSRGPSCVTLWEKAAAFLVLLSSFSGTRNNSGFVYVDALSAANRSNMKVVVVGLNGALQKRFVLPEGSNLIPGNVHRAGSIQEGVGGKGQDVAVALSCCGVAPNEVCLAQFVGGGPGGDQVLKLLEDKINPVLTVRTVSAMRTCTTIVGSACSTELVEPSGIIEPAEMDQMTKEIDTLLSTSSTSEKSFCGALCIMGSMPPGCAPETYSNLYKKLGTDENCITLIDSVIGLEPLLTAMSESKSTLSAETSCLKLNAAELAKLANVKTSGEEADGVTVKELKASVQGFLETFEHATSALSYLAITDGKHPGHLVHLPTDNDNGDEPFQIYKMDVANLMNDEEPRTLFPIGAGDTVAGGTLAMWRSLQPFANSEDTNPLMLDKNAAQAIQDRRQEYETAIKSSSTTSRVALSFAFGLACGSASCLQEENSVFAMKDAVRLFHDMKAPVQI
jgi:fructose-1-phosphate kinase PfkB-like protein